MPKVSEEYLETKQNHILDAALICFARQGFDRTTIEDICQEARMSHGAIYRYFCAKEDILEACFWREHQARKTRNSAMIQTDDAGKMLEETFSNYFQRRAEAQAETMVKFRMQLFGEAARNPRIMEIDRSSREEMLDSIERVIIIAQEQGKINPHLDGRSVSRVVMALADGFYVQNVITPNLDLEKCLHAVKEIFRGNLWITQKREEGDGNESQ
jgi:TetR/AcrR family transcriptional repressor of uid operon